MQVSPGDLIVTEKLGDIDVNDKIRIQRVLMLGSRYESIIGRPLVPGAYVTAAIEVRRVTSAKLDLSSFIYASSDRDAVVSVEARQHAVSPCSSFGRRGARAKSQELCSTNVLPVLCRSNSRMQRCSSSKSGAGRTQGALRDTDRWAPVGLHTTMPAQAGFPLGNARLCLENGLL